MVEIGDTAPDFTLDGSAGEEIREFTLSDYLGETPAILVFYIYDYSPVCTEQMCEVDDVEFVTFGEDATVLGISTDGPYSHRQFAAEHDLSYPLLSDPDKTVYEDYGMTVETDDGRLAPRRGIVVVDTDRTVLHRWVADDNWEDWSVDRLEEAIDAVRAAADA